MMISEPKILRTGRNHEKWTAAEANHLNTVLKTMLKIVIFRKILDADPTEITSEEKKKTALPGSTLPLPTPVLLVALLFLYTQTHSKSIVTNLIYTL